MDYKIKILDLIQREYHEENTENINLVQHVSKVKGDCKYLCIFGVGILGRSVYGRCKKRGLHVDFFCDNNPLNQGRTIVDDVKCISFEELCKIKDYTVVFVSVGEADVVIDQLRNNNFMHFASLNGFHIAEIFENIKLTKEEFIQKITELLSHVDEEPSLKMIYNKLEMYIQFFNGDYLLTNNREIYTPNQYLTNEVVRFDENSIVVDCGAYSGGLVNRFIDMGLEDKLSKYYAYEMDSDAFELLENSIKEFPDSIKEKCIAYNLGVGDSYKEIKYNRQEAASEATADGEFKAQLVPLSQHLKDVPVTFVDMDIEGTEMSALVGASELIKTYKPTLAICVYHKFADLWEIPLYIKSLVPEYKLFFRHHTKNTPFETVCYAAIEK